MPGLPGPCNILYEITSLFKLTNIGFYCFRLRIQSNKYAWVKSQTLKILAEGPWANYLTSFGFSSLIYKMKTIQCNRSWAYWEGSLWFSLGPSSFDSSVCSYGIIIILRTQEVGFHSSPLYPSISFLKRNLLPELPVNSSNFRNENQASWKEDRTQNQTDLGVNSGSATYQLYDFGGLTQHFTFLSFGRLNCRIRFSMLLHTTPHSRQQIALIIDAIVCQWFTT